jgi:hypothetical protein
MDNQSRRSFFKTALMGIGIIPFLKVTGAFAQATDKIKANLFDYVGKAAKKIKFVEKSADAKGTKKWTEGSNCGNCSHFKVSKEDANYGKCVWVKGKRKYFPTSAWCKHYKKSKK